MVRENLTELNRSLKQAFSDVARDMEKLRKRDEKLKDEIARLSHEINRRPNKEDINSLSKKIDNSLDNSVTKDELKQSEIALRSTIEKATSIPDNRAKKMEESIGAIDEDLDQLEKDMAQKLKEVGKETAKIDEIKNRLKEISELKKQIDALDKKFAPVKSVENNQHDIEEIYQILDALESSYVNKEDIAAIDKKIQSKLKRFEDQIKDTEDIEEELSKKTKDIYDIERGVDSAKKDMESMKASLKSLDNTKDIDKVRDDFTKELNKIDNKVSKQNESIKDLERRMNSLIKAIEKGSKFSGLKEDTKKNVSGSEKTKKQPVQKKNGQSKEDTESRSIWRKIVDWLTEEVDE